MDDRAAKAIAAALCSDWPQAAALNAALLKNDPQNIDCLNRLGKALLETGETKKAVTVFRRVLKLDRYNSIAQKNLTRAGSHTLVKNIIPKANIPLADSFLEEPGRTKLVSLVNLAPAKILLRQNQADQVNLNCKRHTVIVTDSQDNYLGSLPDDIGRRLATLISGGNEYYAITKSINPNSLVIFLRETKRAKRFANVMSFTSGNTDYLSYLRDETSGKPETDGGDGAEEAETTVDRLHADEETDEHVA